MKIGIFDSGIGGLSVLHEAYHYLPEQNYIFYADTEHVPYGLKTPEQILEYSIGITEFLLDKGVDAIVVACNTATSVAIKELRKRYGDNWKVEANQKHEYSTISDNEMFLDGSLLDMIRNA